MWSTHILVSSKYEQVFKNNKRRNHEWMKWNLNKDTTRKHHYTWSLTCLSSLSLCFCIHNSADHVRGLYPGRFSAASDDQSTSLCPSPGCRNNTQVQLKNKVEQQHACALNGFLRYVECLSLKGRQTRNVRADRQGRWRYVGCVWEIERLNGRGVGRKTEQFRLWFTLLTENWGKAIRFTWEVHDI